MTFWSKNSSKQWWTFRISNHLHAIWRSEGEVSQLLARSFCWLHETRSESTALESESTEVESESESESTRVESELGLESGLGLGLTHWVRVRVRTRSSTVRYIISVYCCCETGTFSSPTLSSGLHRPFVRLLHIVLLPKGDLFKISRLCWVLTFWMIRGIIIMVGVLTTHNVFNWAQRTSRVSFGALWRLNYVILIVYF